MTGRWFLPTHNRPDRCRAVLEACARTGMDTPATLIVNGREHEDEYFALWQPHSQRWDYRPLDQNLGFCGALNWALAEHPDLDWYGFLSDDAPPQTAGWDALLLDELSAHGTACRMVTPNDGWLATADLRNDRFGPCAVFDGDLLRAMGFWALPGLWHSCADHVWEGIGRIFRCWQTRMDVMVPHDHAFHRPGDGDPSARLAYGNGRLADDREVYEAWLGSDDRRAMNHRIAVLLGVPLIDQRLVPAVAIGTGSATRYTVHLPGGISVEIAPPA